MKDNLTSEQILTACGGSIEDPAEFPSELYRGERIYFCLESCRRAFLSDPQRFLAGELDHTADYPEQPAA